MRRFVRARDAGDDADADRHWHDLVTVSFDRLQTMVKLESRGRLSDEEQKEAVQDAALRLTMNMRRTFAGTTMGELVNAMKPLVKWACIDVQRAAESHSSRRAQLPDEEDGEDTLRGVDPLTKASKATFDAEEADRIAAEACEDQIAFFNRNSHRLKHKRREVLELDAQGIPSEEIAERLSASRDVVYQSRRRGLQDMQRLAAAEGVTP